MPRALAGRPGPAPSVPGMTGVLGTGPGVGVTHLSILLAVYLRAARRRRAALLELGDGGDFRRILEFGAGRQLARRELEYGFPFCGITWFPEAGSDTIAFCLSGHFQELILDLGHGFDSGKADFLRCRRRILVGSASEWRQEAFLKVLAENRRACRGDWSVLAAFGNGESLAEIEAQLRVRVGRIPFWPDPFHITGDMMVFLEHLINPRGRQL